MTRKTIPTIFSGDAEWLRIHCQCFIEDLLNPPRPADLTYVGWRDHAGKVHMLPVRSYEEKLR